MRSILMNNFHRKMISSYMNKLKAVTMGGCVSDVQKRVSPERTKKANKREFNSKIDRNSSLTEKNSQKENNPFLDVNQIVCPNKQVSTKAPSQNEDPELEEIRNETKARIIRKGKKKNVNLNHHETTQAKSNVEGPQKIGQKLSNKDENAEEDNSQKERARSRNSFELAQNSVYVSKQKESCSNVEKQEKITKGMPKQESQDLCNRQQDQNLGESIMTKSKVRRMKLTSAVEDLSQQEVKSPQKDNQEDVLQGSNTEDGNNSKVIKIENVSFSIPKQRAGPLIVSRIDYHKYKI